MRYKKKLRVNNLQFFFKYCYLFLVAILYSTLYVSTDHRQDINWSLSFLRRIDSLVKLQTCRID